MAIRKTRKPHILYSQPPLSGTPESMAECPIEAKFPLLEANMGRISK
jgi:hypothetical protein